MELVLFDDAARTALYPFTHTRATADIRCGIITARERWERFLNYFEKSKTITVPHLQALYTAPSTEREFLLVNGRVIATQELAKAVESLGPDEALISADSTLIAARIKGPAPIAAPLIHQGIKEHIWKGEVTEIKHPWDIFSLNETVLRQDFLLVTEGRTSAKLPDDISVRGTEIFLEDGAKIGAATVINATYGPVYIGRQAEVMEGSIIRGPFALCEGSTLKMAAKIYGGTTIGPGCKVGGEVSNTVFFANSNKGHDGFLGNAVIGEWCNLGADTNSSNLKNNYDEVKVWDEAAQKSIRTGLTFCGLLMGDHSKCGINTMFNTGTIAGVSCNIWGAGFPEKFLPSFSWGGPEGMTTYQFNRAMETAERMMARRNRTLSEAERQMLRHVFDTTSRSRSLVFKDTDQTTIQS